MKIWLTIAEASRYSGDGNDSVEILLVGGTTTQRCGRPLTGRLHREHGDGR
jgi:hypothetical protein